MDRQGAARYQVAFADDTDADRHGIVRARHCRRQAEEAARPIPGVIPQSQVGAQSQDH